MNPTSDALSPVDCGLQETWDQLLNQEVWQRLNLVAPVYHESKPESFRSIVLAFVFKPSNLDPEPV